MRGKDLREGGVGVVEPVIIVNEEDRLLEGVQHELLELEVAHELKHVFQVLAVDTLTFNHSKSSKLNEKKNQSKILCLPINNGVSKGRDYKPS